jgi:hypothetical protein
MIEAKVTPNLPPAGASLDNVSVLTAFGTPKVELATDGFTIQAGETMQVDGTLVVNGTLVGSGLPQPDAPATALNNLTDVTISGMQPGQVLKWNGSAWVNDIDDTGVIELSSDQLTDVQFNNLQVGQYIKWDGSRWINTTLPSSPDRLSELQDVDIQGVQDGSALRYESSTNKWEIGSLNLSGLGDVNLGTPVDSSTLQYDATTGKWNAVSDNDFVDALIDAGNADADQFYIDALDIDGGFAA